MGTKVTTTGGKLGVGSKNPRDQFADIITEDVKNYGGDAETISKWTGGNPEPAQFDVNSPNKADGVASFVAPKSLKNPGG